MKPHRPVDTYTEDAGYPPAPLMSTSRRGFLSGIAASAGTVAASLLDARDGLAAPRGLQKVKFYLNRPHAFDDCDYVVESVVAQTRDRALAAFLANEKKQAGIEAVLLGVLRRSVCADVTNAKRLAALERRLSGAVSAHYHRLARRKTQGLVTTLGLTKPRRNRRPGVAPRPRFPL